jgi:hypothetical protein
MYLRSIESSGHRESPRIHGVSGLADSALNAVGITPELLNQLTDLVFYARHPDLKGRGISADERTLKLDWKAIRDRLANPSSTVAPAGFVIDLTPPRTDPPADFSKTQDELEAWELAIFDSTIRFAFGSEEINMSGGRLGSHVSRLSVTFDAPRFTVLIANHLLENAQDKTKSREHRANWLQTLRLIRAHAYVHLQIYRRAARAMEKVLREILNRLVPIPTAKKPLAVSKKQLDEYLHGVGDFLNAIVVREFWEKTCDWEKQDYPELSRKINRAGAVFMPTGLKVNCGPKPSVPSIPLLPVPVKGK